MSVVGTIQAGTLTFNEEKKIDEMETIQLGIPQELQEILFHFDPENIKKSTEWHQEVNALSEYVIPIQPKIVYHFKNELSPLNDKKITLLVNFIFSYHYYLANHLENEEEALKHALSFSLLYLLLKNKGIFPENNEIIFKTYRGDLFYNDPGDQWRCARNELMNKFRSFDRNNIETMILPLFEIYNLEPVRNTSVILFKNDTKIIPNLFKKK